MAMFGARSTAIKAGEDLAKKIMLEREKQQQQQGPAPRPNIYYNYETASEVDNIVSSAPKRRKKPPIRALSPLRGISRRRRSAYQQKRHSSSTASTRPHLVRMIVASLW